MMMMVNVSDASLASMYRFAIMSYQSANGLSGGRNDTLRSGLNFEATRKLALLKPPFLDLG